MNKDIKKKITTLKKALKKAGIEYTLTDDTFTVYGDTLIVKDTYYDLGFGEHIIEAKHVIGSLQQHKEVSDFLDGEPEIKGTDIGELGTVEQLNPENEDMEDTTMTNTTNETKVYTTVQHLAEIDFSETVNSVIKVTQLNNATTYSFINNLWQIAEDNGWDFIVGNVMKNGKPVKEPKTLELLDGDNGLRGIVLAERGMSQYSVSPKMAKGAKPLKNTHEVICIFKDSNYQSADTTINADESKEDSTMTTKAIKDMNMKELTREAKGLKIKGYSSMRKAALITAIETELDRIKAEFEASVDQSDVTGNVADDVTIDVEVDTDDIDFIPQDLVLDDADVSAPEEEPEIEYVPQGDDVVPTKYYVTVYNYKFKAKNKTPLHLTVTEPTVEAVKEAIKKQVDDNKFYALRIFGFSVFADKKEKDHKNAVLNYKWEEQKSYKSIKFGPTPETMTEQPINKADNKEGKDMPKTNTKKQYKDVAEDKSYAAGAKVQYFLNTDPETLLKAKVDIRLVNKTKNIKKAVEAAVTHVWSAQADAKDITVFKLVVGKKGTKDVVFNRDYTQDTKHTVGKVTFGMMDAKKDPEDTVTTNNPTKESKKDKKKGAKTMAKNKASKKEKQAKATMKNTVKEACMSAGIHTKEGFEAVYNATKEIFNLQAEGLLIDDSFMSGNTAKFQRKVLTKMANLEYAGKDFLAKKYSKLYHALETVKKNNAEKGMNKVLRVALKIGMAIALFTVELAKTSLDVVFTIIMTAFNLVLNLGVQVVEAVKNAISFVTTKDEVLA